MRYKDSNKLKIGTIVKARNTHKTKRVDKDPLWIVTNKYKYCIRNEKQLYMFETVLVSGVYIDEHGKEHLPGFKREYTHFQLIVVEHVKLINGEIREVD